MVFGAIMWLGESSLSRASPYEALGLVGATIGEVTAPLGGCVGEVEEVLDAAGVEGESSMVVGIAFVAAGYAGDGR